MATMAIENLLASLNLSGFVTVMRTQGKSNKRRRKKKKNTDQRDGVAEEASPWNRSISSHQRYPSAISGRRGRRRARRRDRSISASAIMDLPPDDPPHPPSVATPGVEKLLSCVRPWIG
ncbi:hypothetical protein DAI22_01g132501 [Oryza sativa Japonica Group]|nr:hypothetical protein DAI22_01g132501 [Oryza sativa Japonica Group]